MAPMEKSDQQAVETNLIEDNIRLTAGLFG